LGIAAPVITCDIKNKQANMTRLRKIVDFVKIDVGLGAGGSESATSTAAEPDHQ